MWPQPKQRQPEKLCFEFGECERLEQRRMLDGTVSAVVSGGQLTLNGDRLSNQLRVNLESASTLRITGENGTQINWNGDSAESHVVDVPGNLTLRLRDGNDVVKLTNDSDATFSGAVSIDLANGHDALAIDDWDIGNRLVVNTGSQNDSVTIRNTQVARNLSIQTRAGNDQFLAEDIEFQSLALTTDNGNDVVELAGQVAGSQSTIHLGNGSDRLNVGSGSVTSSGTWNLGNGNDIYTVDAGTVTQAVVDGKRGNDTLQSDTSLKSIGFEKFCDANGSNCNSVLRLNGNPDRNTRLIEQIVLNAGRAIIPAGSWPVRPIAIGSNASIVGQGIGISELRLMVQRPTRYEDQHVIASAIPPANQFIENIAISNITINGNQSRNNWTAVYNDGNAHGIYVRATANSTFEDIEIKNCHTDGIYVSTVLGQTNNSHHNSFERINIHDCGRQGVSVVGGEDLTFNDFNVSNIGQKNWGKSPRSAIDLEPEYGVFRLIRNIEITNWTISNVGQGILVSGGHSSEQAENITIRDINIVSMNGPQILAVREVNNLVVENLQARVLRPNGGGGLGVYLKDTVGVLTNVTISNVQKTNFGVRVLGESDVLFNNLLVSNVTRSFMQIGSDAGQPAENTRVVLNGFQFDRAASDNTGLPLIRVNSTENVYFVDGSLTNVGSARFVAQLETDTHFYNCTFSRGSLGWFDPSKDGKILGTGNNWE